MARRIQNILIAVVGLTPQVVTETLWALYHRKPPVHVSRVWILTAQAGRGRCLEDLLKPQTGYFHAFCKEYGIGQKAIDLNTLPPKRNPRL